MQSKTTFNTMRKVFRSTAMMLGFLSLFMGWANAQTYVNGNLSTGATLSTGAAAPAGTTWSEVQLGNTNAGFNAAITQGAFRVADNFVVPAGPSWNITSMRFYGYQTGYAGTASPFTTIRITIHSGTVTGPVVFGDQTTNRLTGTAFANMYRTFNATNDLTRRIWSIDAAVNVSLAPGTYWIEYATDVTGGAGHFLPNSTFPGQVTQPGNNAQSLTIATNTWAPALDGANPQDMPFTINYNTVPCAGTPAPGNTLSTATSICSNIGYTLSLQNPTVGGGVTYQWLSSTTGAAGSYTPIAGATNSTYSTSSTVTTWYQATVTCSGNSGTSTPVQVTVTPCYCTAGATSTAFEKIGRVAVGTINNASTSTAGYEDFTTLSTNVFQGSSMPITVTLTGGFAADQVRVWIDFNKDYDFDDAGELVYTSANGVGPHAGTLTIPGNAPLGSTRMRVRMHDTSLGANGTPCGTSTYGQVEDYTVNIVPCVPVTVTTQPANTSVACSGNATFTVALAGSIPSGYWQYRTSATGTWINVPAAAPYSGVTTTTLTITNAPGSFNGYQYRFVHSGVCSGADFSNAATLTVTPLTATVSNTLPINKCAGSAPVAISVTNLSGATATASTPSGTLHTVIPDTNDPDAGENTAAINHTINVTNIPAGVAISGYRVRINMTHSWAGDMIFVLKAPNGKIVNLDYALSSTGGVGPTTGFTNTVITSNTTPPLSPLLSSGANPWTGTFRMDNAGPSQAGFTPTGPAGFDPNTIIPSELNVGNGAWTLAAYDYYGDFTTTNFLENWEISIDYGAPATGVFTPSTGLFTDPAGTVPYTGTAINTVYANPAASATYSLVVTTATCTSGALSIPVIVRQLPTAVAATPATSVCVGGTTTITAAVTGGVQSQYQWQVSNDGGATYTNIANGGVYSGATTATLTITGATAALNNNRYRVVVSATPCTGTLTSVAGTLTVNPLPVLNVTANPFTAIYPGQTTTLSVASTTTVPANGYTWRRNGVIVQGATGNTLVVDVDALGEYTVSVSDANSCGNAVPASITITSAPSDILFIYPSPNSGQFQIRYQSAAGNIALPRVVNVYDSKGARVYSKVYNVSLPYTRMDVDMSSFQKGVYQVELADNNGNRIKTGRVVIL